MLILYPFTGRLSDLPNVPPCAITIYTHYELV